MKEREFKNRKIQESTLPYVEKPLVEIMKYELILPSVVWEILQKFCFSYN